MARFYLAFCSFGCILAATAPAVMAQSTSHISSAVNMTSARSEASRSDQSEYDRRALRFESHRGTIRVLQGNDGIVVGKTEWFRRFDLASIVSSSDRAVSEAQEFNRNRTPGMWALTLGILAVAADGIIVRANDGPDVVTSVLGIGGVALIAYGAGRLDAASEALSKSLWWYNRDLRK